MPGDQSRTHTPEGENNFHRLTRHSDSTPQSHGQTFEERAAYYNRFSTTIPDLSIQQAGTSTSHDQSYGPNQTENLHSPRGFHRLTSHDKQQLRNSYEYTKANETPEQIHEKERRRRILTGEKYEIEEKETLLNNVRTAIRSAGGFLNHINRKKQGETQDRLFFKDASKQLQELKWELLASDNIDYNNIHLVWLRDMMHADKHQTFNQWITDKYPNCNPTGNTDEFQKRVDEFCKLVRKANIPHLENS